MESKNQSSSEIKTDVWNKSLRCWRTSSTGPQCLCVETWSEVHLLPYGYLRHATFSTTEGTDTITIQFQDLVVLAKGRGLRPLCDALRKFSVEQIRTCPEKLTGFAKDEGVIEEIEVQNIREKKTDSELKYVST